MRFYLVRHAYAGQHGDPRYPDDSLRPLTKKGRKQFAKLVRRLSGDEFAPEVIGTSPLVRCRQTAETLAENLRGTASLEVVDSFAPGCRVDDVIKWVKDMGKLPAAYVGHAPDIDNIAAALLSAGEGAIHFAKGAIAAIECEDELAVGKATLEWLATPNLLRRSK